jgi:hypothetical protein
MAAFPSRTMTIIALNRRKGKPMISAEALAALSGLEHGARYNTMHSIARELIEAGYACEDWGNLGITESGRSYLRRGQFRIKISGDEQACDLSVHQMQIPDAPISRKPLPFWTKDSPARPRNRGEWDPAPDTTGAAKKPLELVEEAPSEPLPAASSRMQAMLRAAGVASGITGVWPDERWVLEFVKALDGVFSEAKTEPENTP